MSAILYPVADNAERALNAPLGRAARESEARRRAGGEVRFVSEATGPAFPTREAALDAWRGRLDDERPDRRVTVAPEDRWCALREVLDPDARRRRPARVVRPAFRDGRRWPPPPEQPPVAWRLSVSYWKVVGAEEAEALAQARRVRRDPQAGALDPGRLGALTRQPLKPFKPQQPLDIGLFEQRLPEDPDRIIPDE